MDPTAYAYPTPEVWYQQNLGRIHAEVQQYHQQLLVQLNQELPNYRNFDQQWYQQQARPHMQPSYPLPYPHSQTQPYQLSLAINPWNTVFDYQLYPQPHLHPRAHWTPSGAHHRPQHYGRMQVQHPPQAQLDVRPHMQQLEHHGRMQVQLPPHAVLPLMQVQLPPQADDLSLMQVQLPHHAQSDDLPVMQAQLPHQAQSDDVLPLIQHLEQQGQTVEGTKNQNNNSEEADVKSPQAQSDDVLPVMQVQLPPQTESDVHKSPQAV